MKRVSEAWLKKAALLLVGFYRSLGPALLGGACRFEPSCSEYAADALNFHSTGKAVGLIARRLSKCRPGGPHGFDPVPTGGN